MICKRLHAENDPMIFGGKRLDRRPKRDGKTVPKCLQEKEKKRLNRSTCVKDAYKYKEKYFSLTLVLTQGT